MTTSVYAVLYQPQSAWIPKTTSMDRSPNGAYDRTRNITSSRMLDTPIRLSADGGGSAGGSGGSGGTRLQKKPSNAALHRRQHHHTPTKSSIVVANTATRPHDRVAQEGPKARKGSLRQAVRRIFGRRSKEIDLPNPTLETRPSPRHGYHKSESAVLQPPFEESAPRSRGSLGPFHSLPHRTLSAPLGVLPSPDLNRMRSPYAVEFPQSARLKPINLGNPFSAPGSQLRRRKTLPSVLVPDEDAAEIAASIESGEAQEGDVNETRISILPQDGLRMSRLRKENRYSRSVDNLQATLAVEQSTPRKRSDEIRFWRESYQGSVVRQSGLSSVPTSNPLAREDADQLFDAKTTDDNNDPFIASEPSAAPSTHFNASAHERHVSEGVQSVGTDLSRDLEDRVAKLEAGLQDFQRSLQRLNADRNRRTVIMGGVPHQGGTTESMLRTPSMLADTLIPLAGTESYTNEAIPSFPSPPSSARPLASPPIDTSKPTTTSRPLPASSLPSTPTSPYLPPPPPPPPQQHTFRSLYEMLTDERSARRRLETQMRGMRRQIADLQGQITSSAQGSNGQSVRSSGTTAAGAAGGGSRVVSRFSASESELGGMAASRESLAAGDVFRTRGEGAGRFVFGDGEEGREESDGEMF